MKQRFLSLTAQRAFSRLVAIAFVIGSILALVPWLPTFPAIDLDSAYAWATNVAVERGLVFGRDFIYNYGPLGSALTQMYSPGTDHLMIATDLLMALSFSAGALLLAQGRASIRLILLYVFVVLAPGLEIIFQITAVICITAAIQTTEQPNASALRSRTLETIAFMLMMATLAVMPLIKGSFLTTSLLAIPVSIFIIARRRPTFALLLAIEAIAFMLLFWILAGQKIGAIGSFFASQLPIISTYTDAMSSGGRSREPIVYVLCLIILLAIVYRFHARAFRLYGAIWLACVAAIAFFVFKLSFVRHDAHALHAAAFLPLAALVMTMRMHRVLAMTAVWVALVAWASINPKYGVYPDTQQIQERLFARNAGAIAGLNLRARGPAALHEAYANAVERVRTSERLPEPKGSTDIYGIQQGLLIAQNFEWSPRPIIQSYQVTGPTLARINQQHLLSANAPKTVYFSLSPIDDRLPAIEDGLSWPVLLQNYKIREYTGQFLVMDRISSNEAPALPPLSTQTVRVGESTPIPAQDGIVWAQIALRPSLLGRLVSLLYKLPELKIVAHLADGRDLTYRYIASMGTAGVVLSPVVRNTPEFAMLASSEQATYFANFKPTSFGITGSAGTRWLWSNTMNVSFYHVAIPAQPDVNSILFTKPLSSSDAAAIGSAPTGGDCSVDRIDGGPVADGATPSGQMLQVSGWAMYSGKSGVPADKIVVALSNGDGKVLAAEASTYARPDIASYFKIPDAGKAGFSVLLNTAALHGNYELTIAAKHGEDVHVCPIKKTVEFK